jgi:hypothetical protein
VTTGREGRREVSGVQIARAVRTSDSVAVMKSERQRRGRGQCGQQITAGGGGGCAVSS